MLALVRATYFVIATPSVATYFAALTAVIKKDIYAVLTLKDGGLNALISVPDPHQPHSRLG